MHYLCYLTINPHILETLLIPMPLPCGLFLQAVCIENSCLVRGSKEGSNGALHLMRTLLKPAEKSMFEILTENGGFKYVKSNGSENGLWY